VIVTVVLAGVVVGAIVTAPRMPLAPLSIQP
jgi:hypothetical protein